MRAVRWWNRFLFRPASGATFALYRTLLGFTVVAWMLSLLPDLTSFYSDSGLEPHPRYGDYRFGLFRWLEGDTAIWVVYALTLAAAVVVTVGRGARLGAPAMFVGVMSFQLDNPTLLNGGDLLLRTLAAYLAIYAVLSPSAHVDVPLFGRLGPEGRTWPLIPPWGLRLVQIQVTVIYPASVIAKVGGASWLDGSAALRALAVEDFQRFPVPDFIAHSIVIGALLTWATLAVEAALPALLWFPHTRRAAVMLGVGLHLSFDYALRLGFFGWAMAAAVVTFLPAADTERLVGWAGRRLARQRAPAGAAAEG